MIMMKVDSTYELIKDLYLNGKHFAAGLMFCCLDRDDTTCRLVLLMDIDNSILVDLKTFENFFVEK